MSEFTYACPVCGQHIRCDSSQAGTVMECPTCFQKITVPQAPATDDPKFIITGTKVGERPALNIPEYRAIEPEKKSLLAAVIVVVVLAGAAATAWFAFNGKIFQKNHDSGDNPNAVSAISIPAPSKHGAIGLGSWNTEVEYSNVVVTKGRQVLYTSKFNSGTDGWRIAGGAWIATNGVLFQTSSAMNCRAVTGDTGWGGYTLSVRARKIGGREGFLIMFNVADEQNWTWWNVGGWGNTRLAIENCVSGRKSTLGSPVPGHITTGQWYDLRVELDGRQIRCYLDGALVHNETYPASP